MKKVLGIIAMAIMVSVGRVYADEGMWLPMFVERLNYVDMQLQHQPQQSERRYRGPRQRCHASWLLLHR